MKDNDAYALMAKYNINPSQMGTSVSMSGNTIFVKKGGKYYSLTVTPGANKNQILSWGKQYGVDLSNYV